MKILFVVFPAYVLLLFITSFSTESGWIKLPDKNLNQWVTFISYRFKDDYSGSIPVNFQTDIKMKSTIKPSQCLLLQTGNPCNFMTFN